VLKKLKSPVSKMQSKLEIISSYSIQKLNIDYARVWGLTGNSFFVRGLLK
jgi:hypothetical protein